MKKWKSALLFFALVLCFTCARGSDTQAAIKLNRSSLSLLEGQSATLKLTGTKKTVTWKTNKKTVATVSKKGKVSAKAPGNAVISATVGKTTKK
ncbi:MAG: Ig domain-containing protein, partial [Lachnospiraceae bacterium]